MRKSRKCTDIFEKKLKYRFKRLKNSIGLFSRGFMNYRGVDISS